MQVLTLNTVIDHFGHTGAAETRCKHQDSIYRAVRHNAIAFVCFLFFFSFILTMQYILQPIYSFFSQCGTGFVMLQVGKDEER